MKKDKKILDKAEIKRLEEIKKKALKEKLIVKK